MVASLSAGLFPGHRRAGSFYGGTDAGTVNINSRSRQIRFYQPAWSKTAAGMDVDAVVLVIVSADGNRIRCICRLSDGIVRL